jgi:hypothetical protein
MTKIVFVLNEYKFIIQNLFQKKKMEYLWLFLFLKETIFTNRY